MKLWQYLIRRIILMVPLLIGVSLITFTVSHLVPGDPARLAAGLHASPETVEAMRHRLGLDKPLPVQYYLYMMSLLHGDLGTSIMTRRPVIKDIMIRWPGTIELTTAAMSIIIILGIPLGVISATHRDKLIDHASRIFSLLGVSMPSFWLALILQLIFCKYLKIFPVGYRIDPAIGLRRITGFNVLDSLLTLNFPALVNSIWHMILPAFTLGFQGIATVQRLLRSNMLDSLTQDYVKLAKAKGMPERIVIYKHVLRNSMIPVVTVLALMFGGMLGGTFIIETIFSWQGLGRYGASAILNLDFPAIMGVTLIYAVIFAVANLVVDILYAYLDPRIRY
ncbi:ABC transporter permease [Candidatus Bathyarchaeota archaeon]|nr:MAG: ABC transporter permease [Candidatus Bathyarchaeota archaeon]